MKLSVFLACATTCSFLVAISAHAQQLVFPTETWPTSTPEAVLVDSAKLAEAVDFLRQRAPADGPGVEEMVIIRNGRLIWDGSQSHRAHQTYSVTKSFATTALGLAIDNGLVTLDTLVADHLPELRELYPEMTLRHAATHTSGYIADGEIYPVSPERIYGPEDPFTPGTPLFFPPGSQFAYSNTAMTQMMHVITRVAGEPVQDLFQRRIGDVIGMAEGAWDWGHYTTDDGLAVDGGGGDLDKGIVISATDFARFGHLFLNHGNWDGQQLLSSEWTTSATTLQVPETMPSHALSPLDGIGPGSYGFGWWIETDEFQASGYENNLLTVMTDVDLIVARLGASPDGLPWFSFRRQLRASLETEARWDGLGDGDWEDIDSGTGKTRWLGEEGQETIIYPHNHAGSVRISSNTVTATEDHRVGTLNIDGGELRIEGAVSIDRANVAGTLHLHGADARLEVGGILAIRGGSLQFTLQDSGFGPVVRYADGVRPTLHGTLELSLSPDMEPAQLLGETFELFDWSAPPSPSSQFTEIALPPGTQWDLANLHTTGEVTLTAIADFDNDGDVDGNDFLAWQAGFGIREEALLSDGDANGDGKVDGDDFLIWQAEFGSGVAASANAVAVPESRSITSVVVLFSCLFIARLSTREVFHGPIRLVS